MTDEENEVLDEDVGENAGEGVDPRIKPLLDDLSGTARMLWQRISDRIAAEWDKIELDERAGVIGARWTGAVNPVIGELWPFAMSGGAEAVPGAVTLRRELHRYLKESDNVVLVTRLGQQGGVYWVRAVWSDAPVVKRAKMVTADMIRAYPEEKKAVRRKAVIDRLVEHALENHVDRFNLTEAARAARAARVGTVTIYGLFDDMDRVNAAVLAELPPFKCDYLDCGRRFAAANNLGRHKLVHVGQSSASEIELVEETRERESIEETNVVANVNKTLRQQTNDLKRRYAALFAFATLEETPIAKSAAEDLAVAGFSLDVRKAALNDLLKSGVIRLERSGGGPGEGRGFEVYVAADPRAALRGSSVDHADSMAADGNGSTDYHAVLGGLLAELDRLRDRDRKTAALREALRGLD